MKITRLEIQNYKAFKDADYLDIGGQNVLIYGNNGSGKSSISHALRTLLRSSTWSPQQLLEHFAPNNPESVMNIYAPDGTESYVQIELDDTATRYRFALNGNTLAEERLRLADAASDFIDYRLLFRFHSFRESQDTDIFPIFQAEFFPYWIVPASGITFEKWRSVLQDELGQLERENKIRTIRRNSLRYRAFLDRLLDFDQAFQLAYMGLIERIHDYMEVYFLPEEPLKIEFQLTRRLSPSQENRWLLQDPILRMSIIYDGRPIRRPHNFLNEARLTALALSIRLAAFDARLKSADLKILVLDDLLISLDMHMRMNVIDVIRGQFSQYQIFILTHDLSFFETLRLNLAQAPGMWKSIQLFENRQNGRYVNPIIRSNDDPLAKAKMHLEKREFDNCAIELRKKIEELITVYFDPTLEEYSRFKELEDLSRALAKMESVHREKLFTHFKRLINQTTLTTENINRLFAEPYEGDGTLAPAEIGRANTLRQSIYKFLDFYCRVKGSEQLLLGDLVLCANRVSELRRRALNKGAHYNSDSIFESELRDGIQLVEQFEDKIRQYMEEVAI